MPLALIACSGNTNASSMGAQSTWNSCSFLLPGVGTQVQDTFLLMRVQGRNHFSERREKLSCIRGFASAMLQEGRAGRGRGEKEMSCRALC